MVVYNVINNEIYDCDPNSDGNQMECKIMGKKGYFMSYCNDILYKWININYFIYSLFLKFIYT